MGERILIDKSNTIIILFSKDKGIWEDKTSSINALFKSYYYNNFTGYDIYFRGSDKKLFYSKEKVEIIKYLKTINVSGQDVIINNNNYNVNFIDVYQNGYYRIQIGKGIIITKHFKLANGKYKDIFNYYKELARYAGEISNDDEPLYYLAQNYERISPSLRSVVYQYLGGINNKVPFDNFIIVPFDFNLSQHKAIDKALSNSISIIEGPPGTGKTQTILNLISNIISNDKNCAVISNNNTAVDNVFDKLSEEGLSFVAAKLGNRQKVEDFFENISNDELIGFLSNNLGDIKFTDRQDIIQYSALLNKLFTLEIKASQLKNLLNDVLVEKKNHKVNINVNIKINHKLKSNDYIKLVQRLEETKKIRLFERWKLNWKYKIKIQNDHMIDILDMAEKLFYDKRVAELEEEIIAIENKLKKNQKESIIKKLKDFSRNYLLRKVQSHYYKQNIIKFDQLSFKSNYYEFLKRYPVILSTSQSLLNNAPKGFLFDYLIIDEASQGDLLSSVIAMSCAKNLIVVGDSRQLQQIDEERLFNQSEILANKYNVGDSYKYASNSILKSVKASVKDVPTTLLREHYRCAPDIINFCNKMFYDNELIPMTKNYGNHINIIKTVPGNHARKNPNGSGMYNQREIDELEILIKDKDKSNIGIITPFRYQANLITDKHQYDELEADTIHKFQGRQKDEIIMSFVVNSLDENPNNIENRLYDFVTNDKLLNVAISRSKHKVTAIVSDKIYHSKSNIIHDFITYTENLYGDSITKTSKVISVFDYLYGEYDNILKDKFKDKPNEHKTELLMCELIDKILKNYNKIGYRMHVRLSKILNNYDGLSEEEYRYVTHPWTHVDFLFYNKVSKEKLFVIEVDGIQYHEQSEKQVIHDEIKNKILSFNKIPVYRFKTNQSNEKTRINEILEKHSY